MSNLHNNRLFQVVEEPEEPIPEEIIEEPPSIEEVEEVAPPRGTAALVTEALKYLVLQ